MPSSDYTPLLSTVISSTATEVSIDISSLQGYRDLIMYVLPYAETADSNGLRIKFNNDSGSNYNAVFNWGKDGGSAGVGYDSNEETSQASMGTAWMIAPGTTSNSLQSFHYFELPAYSNTSLYKEVLMKSRKSNSTSEFCTGRWKSTAAITSIQLRTSAGSGNRIVAGTRIVLWGLKGDG
jgi:hypothetical protein